MKILIIEDDQFTSKFLRVALTACRYTIDVADDGQTGLDMINQFTYDLIILDVMIPRLDGISVCKQLRKQGCKTPILLLTANNSSKDMIVGLDAGADDYLVKPFDLPQLLARIRALLRRTTAVVSPVLTWGELCLNSDLLQVTYKQEDVKLSPQEYRLLELFLRNPLRVFSRNDVIDHLWTIDDSPTEAAVTNLIKDLRRHLKSAGLEEEIIQTIYGLGYRLKAFPQNDVTEKVGEMAKEKLLEGSKLRGLDAIAQASEWFRSSLKQRLEVLDSTEQAMQNQILTSDLREKAREQTHKLVGGLGTFGFKGGSEIARELEQLLQGSDSFEKDQVARFSQLLSRLKQEIIQAPNVLSESSSQISQPLIWLVGTDNLLIETVRHIAPMRGLRVKTISEISEIGQQIQQSDTPDAVLLHYDSSLEKDKSLELFQEIKTQLPQVPILAVAKQDSLEVRRTLANLGSDRYILSSAPLEAVFDTIAQVLPQTTSFDARAMAVDDDPIVLQKLTELLQPWGVQVTTLSSPERFWQVLTETNPDVLLLDLEMPTIQGIELCRLVRQDSKYGDLPILVVTAHTEFEAVQQVFDAGADDFIIKPFVGPELITRVINRVERSRIQKQLLRFRRENFESWEREAGIDRLTQVAKPDYFDNFLNEAWQRLIHEQLPLSLILCSVDYFRTYNKQQGWQTGDLCLQKIVREIQNCTNSNHNLVARYGREAFAIALPSTDLSGALQVAEQIRQAVHRLQIPHPTSPISSNITLSLGIAGTTPTDERSPEDLIEIAEQALHAAKARGSNTCCVYPF